MVPVFVVPAVATTAQTAPASGSASSAARRAAPVSRSSAPVGTTSGSTSMIRSVLTSDECAWSASATRQRGRSVAPLGGGRPRGDERREVAGRAAGHEAAAGRRREVGEVGQPAQRLVLGVDRAAASSQSEPQIADAEITMSNSWLAFVGAHGMNERNAGLSAEMHAGASVSRNQPSTVFGIVARAASIVGPTAAVSSASERGWSSGTGSIRRRSIA